jgi:hypothetical protein
MLRALLAKQIEKAVLLADGFINNRIENVLPRLDV